MEKEKLLKRIKLDGECWNWTGAKMNGYGIIYINKKNMLTHRLSYSLFVDSLSENLVIDHICRNRSCCNPEHLRQVTSIENILCGIGKGAMNAKKNICKYGHDISSDSGYYKEKGPHGGFKRRCRQCRIKQTRESRT